MSERVAREALFGVLAAVALVTLLHLTPPTLFEGVDWLQLHVFNRQYAAAALRELRLPLWNPYAGLGRPFLADVETAVFYPPNLVYLALEPYAAYLLSTIAHAALGILGMLRLGLRLGSRPPAAWACAVLFVASAPLVARLQAGQGPYVHALAYLPWLLLVGARLSDRFERRDIVRLAVLLALQLLCGHPQVSWVSGLGLAVFVAARASARGARVLSRALGALAAALALALALAAPLVLPFAELVLQGNRSSDPAFARVGAMRWFDWLSLAQPDSGLAVFYWEQNLYAGVAVLVGGVAGLLLASQSADGRGVLAMAALGFLVACGDQTPVFGLLRQIVPGLALLRIHSRAAVLVVLALLLGLGWFLSRPLTLRRCLLLLPPGATLCGLAALAFRAARPDAPALGPRLALIAGVGLALAGVASAVRARERRWSAAALGLLVCADLATSVPESKRAWNWPVLHAGERPLREALVRSGLLRARAAPPRIALPPELVRENAGLVYGWSNFAAYAALNLARPWVYAHESLGIPLPLAANTYPDPAIYARGPFPFASMNLVAGSDPGGAWLAMRGDPDPRVYLANAARSVDHWRAAIALMRAGHDFHAVPLLEGASDLPSVATSSRARAEIVDFEPERVELELTAPASALLVIAEAWYPGWEAEVDGVSAPCLPANGWMRAVPVPAGARRVVLRFRSRYLPLGLALAAAALAGIGLALGRGQSTRSLARV
ncbi:MAG: hypothetical protein AB7O37_07555 [Vicinamibacteria bacterium]